ncbi:MAG: gephyrin-like molybdotransferase Glp [Verrucomicrobiota bacterium]
MLSVDQARDAIFREISGGGLEVLPLGTALGRYLGSEFRAHRASPDFDQSAMDGYAVRHDDAFSGAELIVAGRQAAGRDLEVECGPKCAVRVFTGAPIPLGASAVVMQEDVEQLDSNRIRIRESCREGEFIRFQGEDHCAGQVLAPMGSFISAAMIGALASQGLDQVRVGVAPAVRILTTGDELVDVSSEEELRPGEIYNSNAKMLEGLVKGLGINAVEATHANDEPGAVRDLVEGALSVADMVILAGGVSVGDRDLVKAALDGAGAKTILWRVNVRPGKPFLYARRGKASVFGLPGNPVSAFVTFHLFVAPAIRKWMGAAQDSWLPGACVCRLDGTYRNRGTRPHYLTGQMSQKGSYFRALGIQQSHAIGSLALVNGMVRVGPGEEVETGEEVDVFPV